MQIIIDYKLFINNVQYNIGYLYYNIYMKKKSKVIK